MRTGINVGREEEMGLKIRNYLHGRPSYLCCPDALGLVGDPLSGNGCGSRNNIYRIFSNLICTRFSFSELKNQMRIRIACGLDSRS